MENYQTLVLSNSQIFHLFFRRLFLFLDEWLTYTILLILYFHDEILLFSVILFFGTLFIGYSYYGLWKLRYQYGIRDNFFKLKLN